MFRCAKPVHATLHGNLIFSCTADATMPLCLLPAVQFFSPHYSLDFAPVCSYDNSTDGLSQMAAHRYALGGP